VILQSLLPLNLRRRRLARSLSDGPLRRYYETPFPSFRCDWREVEYLALDLETTGTDPGGEEIVCFGWVVLRGTAIDLSTATRRLVRTSKAMPERSALIHAITDDEAETGEPPCAVLESLLDVLAGRVLIAHYAATERGFLDAACRRCFGGGLLVPTVDTLYLARRSRERQQREPAPGELRLAALRDSYNLPRYAAHDALVDAIAAAELFLAQVEELSDREGLPLKALLAPG
jgi:DNA polymerase III subunit epsilon